MEFDFFFFRTCSRVFFIAVLLTQLDISAGRPFRFRFQDFRTPIGLCPSSVFFIDVIASLCLPPQGLQVAFDLSLFSPFRTSLRLRPDQLSFSLKRAPLNRSPGVIFTPAHREAIPSARFFPLGLARAQPVFCPPLMLYTLRTGPFSSGSVCDDFFVFVANSFFSHRLSLPSFSPS